MKEIKKLGIVEINEKFGLDLEYENFIFKPQEIIPNRHLEPHRSEMYSLGLVLKGQAEFIVGIEAYSLKAPCIVVVAPDDIRKWILNKYPVEAKSLFFTQDFIVSGLVDTSFLKKFSFFKSNGQHYITLNPDELVKIQMLFDQIEEKKNSDLSTKLESIQALVRVLLFELESLNDIQIKKENNSFSRSYYLTEKFKELLSENFTEHRDVPFYAEKLFITSKHLSQILKNQTGKTVSAIITEIVCLEAKVLLQTKALNISEISQHLNFATASYFGSFFKRYTGMSPLEYRKSLS
ncbi:AraC family transcriptional activator of pobA [Pedobacter sp. UYP30]|uniref:AraC family transcriptional regulator n=1 Tax=Pedobacter sp. UYP30 TaxID=1756400 RepID=UPI0033912541